MNTIGGVRRRWRWGCVVVALTIAMAGVIMGALTAVGVAWRIAQSPPEFDGAKSQARWSHATGPAWLYQTATAPGAIRIRGQFASETAAGNRRTVEVESPPEWSEIANASLNATGATTKWEEAFGWPRPALMSRIDLTPGGGINIVSGITLKRRAARIGQPVYLPTRPIWSGLTMNAMVFAPAWWLIIVVLLLLFQIIRKIPKWLRKRRGRCPQCGYDLRGKLDDGCSECGWRRTEQERSLAGADATE